MAYSGLNGMVYYMFGNICGYYISLVWGLEDVICRCSSVVWYLQPGI